MEINAGDVVRLKSGGPKMTVEKIENGIAICCFFVKKKLVRETFESAAIELADSP